MTQQPVPSELLCAMSEELIHLAEIVEGLGAALCSDQRVLTEHLTQLQSVDLVSQSLRCQAGLLAADDAVAKVAEVSLEDLRDRLLEGMRTAA